MKVPHCIIKEKEIYCVLYSIMLITVNSLKKLKFSIVPVKANCSKTFVGVFHKCYIDVVVLSFQFYSCKFVLVTSIILNIKT